MNSVYFFKVLLKQKWVILWVNVLTISAALILTKNLKKQYKSTAELSTGFTLSDQVRLQDDKLNLTESDVKFNNVIETITSPKVMSFVSYLTILNDLSKPSPFRNPFKNQSIPDSVKNINLTTAKVIFQNKLDSLEILTSYNPEERKLIELLKFYEYDYQNLLRNNILVGRVAGTDYISIVASTESPELSSFLVNNLCSEFLKYYKSQRIERSLESVDAFKNLLSQKQNLLIRKIDSLKRYKSAHGVLNIESEGKSNYERIQTFQNDLSSERNNYNGITFQLADVKNKISQLGESSGPKVNLLNAEILNLKNEISGLKDEQERKGGNDLVLKTKIENLQNQLINKQEKISSNESNSDNIQISERELLMEKKSDLEIKLKTSAKNIEDYNKDIQVLKNNYSLDATTEANINSLQKEIDLANQDYISVKEKYSQATDLGKSSFNENIRQVLFGQPAISPEPSKRLIIVALSILGSLTLCVFIIFLLEFFDPRIKNPSLFSEIVNLKLIGLVNKAIFKNISLDYIFNSKNSQIQENTIYKELLRKCRYEIEHLHKKIFLITSNKKGEGKTTLIHSLAMTFSNSQDKVLIIDTNFSNNSLSRIFTPKAFIENIVQRQDTVTKDNYKDFVSKTQNPYIDVIGCKGGAYSPSEIFYKDNFKNFLKNISEYYDFVFLEGPSVNLYSHSKELTEYSQGVIAVFSSKNAIKQIDKNSIDFYNSLGSQFTGAILNLIDQEQIDI